LAKITALVCCIILICLYIITKIDGGEGFRGSIGAGLILATVIAVALLFSNKIAAAIDSNNKSEQK
ncbi:MAG: hypothetical protein LBT27_10145, partial [Prevotellaceae bacterium]|nr:hypothetical protein [Prevotellaceae bacterium]